MENPTGHYAFRMATGQPPGILSMRWCYQDLGVGWYLDADPHNAYEQPHIAARASCWFDSPVAWGLLLY